MHDLENTAHPYLDLYGEKLAREPIEALRSLRSKQLHIEKFAHLRRALEGLPNFRSSLCDFSGPRVRIGRPEELSDSEQMAFQAALKAFVPWKKGPFELFGTHIDAEWRSDLKWQRLLSSMPKLAGKKIADIGCHNGYYMLRMAAHDPELVVGFEPYAKHWFAFQLLQRYVQDPRLAFELLGAEHLHLYPQFFDCIFCLGILYHHRDPLGLLHKLWLALRPGGELILDCQGIPGTEPVALMPSGRYAQAKGVWFLPTLSCLENWLKRSQFGQIHCLYQGPLEASEQRTTEWAPIQSLQDFLNPSDPSLTVEGYPAPWRFYLRAKKK